MFLKQKRDILERELDTRSRLAKSNSKIRKSNVYHVLKK